MPALRPLGPLRVSPLGLGCMGMSGVYGDADAAEAMRVLHRFRELGGNFLDTAEVYGPYRNEELLGRFLREVPRGEVVVATKFGFEIKEGVRGGLDGSPANVRRACEGSLQRLGVETIDLFYQHRIDPTVPVEETVGAMAELVRAGKVRALGLSEASGESIRRACAVHPIAALQSEFSLWTRDLETNGNLAACRELGVSLVPYAPLGRGFLTGKVKSVEDLGRVDFRKTNPRFAAEAMERNAALVAAVESLARRKHCTPAQLALAWVLAQVPEAVPIPGTKRVKYLEENFGALEVALQPEDMAELDRAFPQGIAGERYAGVMATWVDKPKSA